MELSRRRSAAVTIRVMSQDTIRLLCLSTTQWEHDAKGRWLSHSVSHLPTRVGWVLRKRAVSSPRDTHFFFGTVLFPFVPPTFLPSRVVISCLSVALRRSRSCATVRLEPQKVYGGTAEQLKAYRVGITPPQNNWVEVEQTVFFQQVRSPIRHPRLLLYVQRSVSVGIFIRCSLRYYGDS